MNNESDTQEATAESYPENWDDHAKAVAASERAIKLKDGGSVTFHLISGPLVFNELYYELPEKNKEGTPKRKRIALPFSAQLPGYKMKAKYMAEVILTDGPVKGVHKLFEFGISVAKQLEKIKSSTWKSTRACDITVSRTGSGMDTEYIVTAIPPSMPAEGNPVEFNLVAEARFSTAEELKALPKPTAMPADSSKVSEKISAKQIAFINELRLQKEMTKEAVEKIAVRKFETKDLDALTSGQASQLIDTLKAL